LGFDKTFCNDAVSEFLDNKYINLDPPQFSSEYIAKSFLFDAIKLSLIDNDFHIEELEWLENVAKVNDIKKEWLDENIKQQVLDYNPQELVNLSSTSKINKLERI